MHWTALVVALLSCAHPPTPSDRLLTLHFPDDFRGPGARTFRELHDTARATASKLPAALRFETAPLVTQPDRLLLPGALINDTADAYEIVVSLDLFTLALQPIGTVTRHPPSGPPLPPPVPTPPMVLEVPAHSRIEMGAMLYLPDWDYPGTPSVVLHWTLATWNGPRPEGSLTTTLPAR